MVEFLNTEAEPPHLQGSSFSDREMTKGKSALKIYQEYRINRSLASTLIDDIDINRDQNFSWVNY